MTPRDQQPLQAGPIRLTRDSLAAFQAELKGQKKHSVVDDLATVQSMVATVGKATDNNSSCEILPDDSPSFLDENSDDTTTTDIAWTRRAMQVFPSPRDFKDHIRTWSTGIHFTPPLNSTDAEKWLKFDAEADSVSRTLLRPPQAPEILIDPSALLNKVNPYQTTQTAESACLEHSLLSPPAGQPQDQPTNSTQVAAPSVVETGNADKPDRSDADIFPKSSLSSPTAPALDVGPNKTLPISGISPSRPIAIHIALAGDDHLDQIRDIYNEEVQDARVPGRQAAATQDIQRLYQTSLQSKFPFLVALYHGQHRVQVLGFGLLQPRVLSGITEPRDLCCAECSVYVRLKFRNRGIGQEILQSLLCAVASNVTPQSNICHGKEEAMDDENKSVGMEAGLWPSYKFVCAKTDTPKSFPPLLHYIIVELAYGNADGLAEKKYVDILTQKFSFNYGGQLDSVFWTEAGPRTVKKMMLYRACEPIRPGCETTIDAATLNPNGGPVQHPISPKITRTGGSSY
ncbi:hypothetical protein SEPCBS119000_003022 [Sporothrix epigloea]|uniref:N-acetyltransferase domain-containing protein n=1 Tax=Sporothrix epigloea TaxID=1892477 RepID=A0ABP0DL73_9PEZI